MAKAALANMSGGSLGTDRFSLGSVGGWAGDGAREGPAPYLANDKRPRPRPNASRRRCPPSSAHTKVTR
jgi:hypothetical protein